MQIEIGVFVALGAAAALRSLHLLVGMLVNDALVFLEIAGDLLPFLVLWNPEPLDFVAVVEVTDSLDVVIVSVGNHQILEPLLPVGILGKDVIEQLEDIDALAFATVDIDKHVLPVGKPDQGAVSLSNVSEDQVEIGHDYLPF